MATVTINYAVTATITCSVASLASSTTAGRASTVVDNSTNKYDTAILSGKITCGTTPTANTIISVYVWGQVDDTPTYPDGITGTDAAFTVTSAGESLGYLKLAVPLSVDSATSNVAYWFSGIDVAMLFGGTMPQRWGVFVVQNTGAALNATAGNHFIKYQGIKYDVA